MWPMHTPANVGQPGEIREKQFFLHKFRGECLVCSLPMSSSTKGTHDEVYVSRSIALQIPLLPGQLL